MNEIEKKALALLNGPLSPYGYLLEDHPVRVLCRAIEAHEAFRQEVSDALEKQFVGGIPDKVARFIIAKPDPLVEALSGIDHAAMAPNECADQLRAALAARGLEIREIEK